MKLKAGNRFEVRTNFEVGMKLEIGNFELSWKLGILKEFESWNKAVSLN